MSDGSERDYQKHLQAQLEVVEKELDGHELLAERAKELSSELKAIDPGFKRPFDLPLLNRLKVAAPCSQDWEKMKGDERTRFCGSCENKVFDLSEMTAADAEALLAEHNMNLCVRFYKRRDGTVMTKDCPSGVSRRRRNRMIAGAIAVGVAGGAVAALSMEESGPVPCNESTTMGMATLGSGPNDFGYRK